MKKITYKDENENSSVAGMILTEGHPESKLSKDGYIKVVNFKSPNGERVYLRCDTRPQLAALAQSYEMERKIEQEKQDREWKEKTETEDAPYLAAMNIAADNLKKLIPSDHIAVEVTQTGDMDGDAILKYEADGIEINWRDVTVHGWAYAIRDGAMNSFRNICIASISREKIEEIKAKKIAIQKAQEEKIQIEKNKIETITVDARETGKKQFLESYLCDCNDPNEECNTDIISVYINSDGSKSSERQHTW